MNCANQDSGVVRLPGILLLAVGVPSLASLLIRALARTSIRIPAGSGQGVVFGRGSEPSELFALGGGGGFRSRSMMDASRRSTM